MKITVHLDNFTTSPVARSWWEAHIVHGLLLPWVIILVAVSGIIALGAWLWSAADPDRSADGVLALRIVAIINAVIVILIGMFGSWTDNTFTVAESAVIARSASEELPGHTSVQVVGVPTSSASVAKVLTENPDTGPVVCYADKLNQWDPSSSTVTLECLTDIRDMNPSVPWLVYPPGTTMS